VAEHRRLAEQAGRAALLEEQLRSLQERYAQLQDGAVSLANRNGWLESKLDEREREIKLLEDSRPKPSFWQRLFGGG
jgi:septal ring factor EnvC (AmiA/AmiB activator)